MASVLHKTTMPADYRPSVHSPDFPTANWFHNPDISAVAAVPTKYWVLGQTVTEMDAGQKAAADTAEANAAKTAAKTAADSAIDGNKGYDLRALAKLIVDELNVLRDDVIGVATFTFDPPSMANAAGATSSNVTVTGAAFGDMVDVAAPYTLQGIIATAYVTAADTVNVRLHNGTGAAVNLASGTWRVVVRRNAATAPRTLAQAKTAYKNLIAGSDLDE